MMTTILEAIKALAERLMASWTEIALTTFGHQAMFMSLAMTTQRAFHFCT